MGNRIFCFLFLTSCLFSSKSFAFGGNGKRVSTPRSGRRGGDPATAKLFEQLEAINRARVTTCDVRPSTAAQCLICNCANEAGRQSDKGQIAVQRVVFSRVKHPAYPMTVCGVIWAPSQFSWTIGVLPEDDRRQKYITRREVRGETLDKCMKNTLRAADIELNERPTQIYALNYYNSKISWPKWRHECNFVEQEGPHRFCTVNRKVMPMYTPEIMESSIAFYKFKKQKKEVE